ncbi:MAG: glycosyltransferase [Nevskiales bacterium]|nr:glycosyltransferase [Nevskiales bacterium]
MKILYIGQLFEGSTCESRRRMLEQLHCTTLAFNTRPYTGHTHRGWRTLAHRFNAGPPVTALNRDLLSFSEHVHSGVDYVWVDKGKWLYPETLRAIRQITGGLLIHYTPDAQFLDHASRHFRACVPLYDLMFTTKPFELDAYRRAGARSVHLVHQSYDSVRLRPDRPNGADQTGFESEVCFVGHCQPYYANCLHTARRAAERLRIWGPGWSRYARRHGWARDVVSGDGLWGDDYARALNAAAIGLCLLSKRIPETTTTRTFEIPGCGTFMLAERTSDHLALFTEGTEAEFFGDAQEMTDKIRFYLRHPALRERIAAAGHRRCLASGYRDLDRVRQMLALAERRRRVPGAETPGIPAPSAADGTHTA